MNKGDRPNTEVSQGDFLRKLSDSRRDVQFTIVDKDSDELIDAIGIHKVDGVHRHGDISVVLGNRKYWCVFWPIMIPELVITFSRIRIGAKASAPRRSVPTCGTHSRN